MTTKHTQQPTIRIEPTGVALFLPIELDYSADRSGQDLLLRIQQALFAYLATIAEQQLPVIV